MAAGASPAAGNADGCDSHYPRDVPAGQAEHNQCSIVVILPSESIHLTRTRDRSFWRGSSTQPRHHGLTTLIHDDWLPEVEPPSREMVVLESPSSHLTNGGSVTSGFCRGSG
jgi:hypothetical protein